MSVYGKIGIAAGGLVALLLLLLLAVPFLFRDRIEARVAAGIHESVNAQVAWERVGISLLRTFPNPSLRLDGLTVTGREPFEGDTLAAAGRLRVVVDLPSVWRNWRRDEPIVVRSVDVDEPVLRLVRLEDGTANWDIVEETPERKPDETRDLAVSLRGLSIRRGTVTVDDRQNGLLASLAGFEQSLRGDFSQDRFTLRTRAGADEVSVRFGGLPYLNRTRLDLRADLEADMLERRFTLRENELELNELALAFSGFVQLPEDEDMVLDLSFEAPATDFRHILSLVPAVYASDFEAVQTSGSMSLSGRVEGRYGENAFPAFSLLATVEGGTFQYPDLPLPAREIALDLAVRNPGGDLDSTVVDLSRFHVVIGDDPIDGALALRTPISDPDVDVRVVGRLDLVDLTRTVRLDEVEELAGVVSADAAVRARMSWLDAGQYERVTARGGAEAHDVVVRTSELPHTLFVDEAVLLLSPSQAELTTLRGRVGESDLRIAGHLDNLLGYLLRNEELRGRATLESRRFDLNDWRSDAAELEVIPVPANIDFAVETTIGELTYGDLALTDARGALRMDEERVTLDGFRVAMLGGDVEMSGYYETTDVTQPTFLLDLSMQGLDIPSAFEQLVTVRTLAPVAGYARGSFSTELRLSGALGPDMVPLFHTLAGAGSLETSRLVLQGFPALERVADIVRIQQLRDPALSPVQTSFDIGDGRLQVRPFEVEVGDLRMSVSGSNGIDQSLQYALQLQVPRALLGSDGERAVTGLLAQAGRAGIDLQAADLIEIGVQLGGTVTDPLISTDVRQLLTSAGDRVVGAVREEAVRRLEEAEQRADEATAAARAEAARLVRQAEERAEAVREEARGLAETVRRDGHAAADSLLARATNPAARVAARPAADQLRREADRRADEMIREADERADRIVREAEVRASELVAESAGDTAAVRQDTIPDPED